MCTRLDIILSLSKCRVRCWLWTVGCNALQPNFRFDASVLITRRHAAFKPRNLQPTFIGEPLTVGFWAAFTYEKHTPLVPLRKRTEEEGKSEKDELGFDPKQYDLLPTYKASGGSDKGVETVEDGLATTSLTIPPSIASCW